MRRFDYFNRIFHDVPLEAIEKNYIISDSMGYIYDKEFFYNRATYNNILLMVAEGTLYFNQYGVKYILTKGDIALLTLMDEHNYYTDKNDTAHVVWFHFRGVIIQPTIDKLIENKKMPIVKSCPEIENYFYDLFDIIQKKEVYYRYLLSAKMYEMIIMVASEALYDIDINNLSVSSFAKKMDMFINSHIYNKNLTLDDLCEEFQMSRTRMCQMFTEHFGTTPMKYVNEIKIQQVKYLLKNTTQSIEMIAHALFFYDQSHLTKKFRNITGFSPMEYRKNNYIDNTIK